MIQINCRSDNGRFLNSLTDKIRQVFTIGPFYPAENGLFLPANVSPFLPALTALSGMSQKQLAAATGIDQSDISKIERGVANPSVSTLERIAKALGGQLAIKIAIPTSK